tara:strand:+ start:221 stop:493 length:273 start_codon:yes stop_codon:yes gene_type:complete
MWKYGLIKIDYPGLWEIDEYCELVELYKDSNGDYASFTMARIKSLKELQNAYDDVFKDGVNTWFADNGTFEWDSAEKFWVWQKNKENKDD